MKKWNNIFYTFFAVCALAFSACGGEGNDSDTASDPDSYVTFTGVSCSSDGEWTGGLSDAAYGSGQPFYQQRTSSTVIQGYGARTTEAKTGWSSTGQDYVLLSINDDQVGIYNLDNGRVEIRRSTLNGGLKFSLTLNSVTISHSGSDYIEGTFTGKDFNINIVNGSFRLTKISDNDVLPF